MGINAGAVKGKGRAESNFAEKQEDLDGVYPARLVQVIDLGLQPQRDYNGAPVAPKYSVYFTFELCDTFMLDKEGKEIEDKPRWISYEIPLYPLVADRAKSTKLAAALDPDSLLNGDFSQMVGFPLNVSLTTTHKGEKTFTNVVGVSQMRAKDAAKLEELKNPTKVFDLDKPDLDVFNSLPDWLKNKIKGNLGYASSKLQALLGDADKDEAPKEEQVPKKEGKKPDPIPEPKEEADADDDAPW